VNIRPRPALVVAGTVLAVAVAPLSVAQASTAVSPASGRLTVSDPAGDMTRVEEGGGNPQPAPGATVGDAVRTTFRHTDRRVVVRVRFTDLARTGKRLNLWADVRDASGHTSILGVEATRADRDGHPILMNNRGRDIACAVRHRISYRDDYIRAALPRRCLGSPAAVKFRVLTEHVRRSWAHAYLDNALSPDLEDRSWTELLRPPARG
jgi:hypothetical protein